MVIAIKGIFAYHWKCAWNGACTLLFKEYFTSKCNGFGFNGFDWNISVWYYTDNNRRSEGRIKSDFETNKFYKETRIMKKVLVVANSFPPMGGPGVQRSSKFVKHLRKFGYEPIVLTRDMANVQVRDETLMQDIPEGVKIVRTKAYETEEWKGIFRIPGKVIARMMIPDGTSLWARMSRKVAVKLVKEDGIEYIYTTSAPYCAHLLGRYVKKKVPQVKWVADFRDEWTNNPYTLDNPHNAFRTRIEKNMEKSVMIETDALVTNTPVMKENFIKNHNIKSDKFHVIPNGYDEEDFAGYEKKAVNNNQFTLVYTGALYGRRKPDTFFEALKQLIHEDKVDGNKIKVRLMGNYYK